MTAAQVEYWEDVLARLVATSEWKEDVERNLWVGNFMRSAECAAEYKRGYMELKGVLTELGLAK
jgi:putative tricarboxylic transport membrane protein